MTSIAHWIESGAQIKGIKTFHQFISFVKELSKPVDAFGCEDQSTDRMLEAMTA